MTLSREGASIVRLALAFGSGFTVLALEIAGARLLASTYGLSSIPWTAVIATVLGGLALGNTLAGIRAMRRRPMLTILFLASGVAALVPIVGAPLPARLIGVAGFLGGSIASSILFFLVPAMLMGAVTPILVERSTETVEEAGLRFGDVGAWSTGGAIVGTAGTGFLLLPHLPLELVLGLVASLFFLFGTGAALLERVDPLRWVALGLSPLPILAGALLANRGNEVFAGQSSYASLRVVDGIWYGDVPVREFWQNGSLSSAEHRVTGEPTQFYKITLGWLLTDRIERLESVLVLGGAANTMPSQLRRMNPRVELTVVEIDPKAVWVAENFFSYGELPGDDMKMRVGDARPFLRADSSSYEVIISDAYDNLYSVPWHLVTREAFGEMAARLEPGGIVTLTVSTPLEGPGAEFLRRMDATMQSVFPYVRAYPTRPELGLDATQEIILVAARSEEDFPRVEWPWLEVAGEGPVLRDDYAPVEFLQAIRFVNDPAWQ